MGRSPLHQVYLHTAHCSYLQTHTAISTSNYIMYITFKIQNHTHLYNINWFFSARQFLKNTYSRYATQSSVQLWTATVTLIMLIAMNYLLLLSWILNSYGLHVLPSCISNSHWPPLLLSWTSNSLGLPVLPSWISNSHQPPLLLSCISNSHGPSLLVSWTSNSLGLPL